jgi:hypothetical protein
MENTLPAQLTLIEDGEWQLPYTGVSTMNVNYDDEEWIGYGWKAVTYEGERHFIHKDKAVVQQWLAERGYIDTGDGSHYRRSHHAPDA